MSIAYAASPSRSSLSNPCSWRYSALISRKSSVERPLFASLSAFPSIVHPSCNSLLYQRKLMFSRKSIRRRIGVLFSGESVGGIQHKEGSVELSFDEFLSAAEIFCVVPPFVFSVGCLLGLMIPGGCKLFQFSIGNKFCVSQFFFLVSALALGGLIRRRQWQRICGDNERAVGSDLIARIEKAEQDVRSSGTVVRVLSRQLEKLGIRFRITRKSLKDSIAETAALAKKNSEATRALVMQEDILQKELVEVQKVLLAMQEHQQKQLELILAIGKAGKLFESKQVSVMEQGETKAAVPVRRKTEGQELERQIVE